jgi:NADH-quinone oxidoreductase subunit I
MSIESISLSKCKKQVSNKEMTFMERLYLVAIFKGLMITIKHLFTRKVTIQYPEQVRRMSPVYRGQHLLKRDEQGRENCTACGLCALSCPAEAITMKAEERKPSENICTARKNTPRFTKSTCCVAFSADCAKKLALKMRFI